MGCISSRKPTQGVSFINAIFINAIYNIFCLQGPNKTCYEVNINIYPCILYLHVLCTPMLCHIIVFNHCFVSLE